MPTWEKRPVGRTQLQVTTLGLGTATMGGTRIKGERPLTCINPDVLN